MTPLQRFPSAGLRRWASAALWFLTLWATGTCAADRLDDSASPRSRVQAASVMSDEGRPLADSLAPTRAIVRVGQVDYKLATARYLGRQARIYHVIPAVISGLRSPMGLQVQWRGLAGFASGSARPGERSLVWSGRITEAFMTATLDLSMQIDLRAVQLPASGNFGVESYFEIEATP
ncbi:MAG: hypothetical protein JWP79_2070 [Polaromonas sp.]|jgi:hypothetical protein|nr:hypothetical protein [Polaromonas sp.]MDB5844760.1 hypothetical protein [Polaromonas sp.]MDB5938641.1 hypothetical protein [Polaromonas sp.]